VGFVAYSAGLVAFVEVPSGWPRIVAALVLFGGLMLAGWARWGMPMPGD
jgi:hypothetical protein